MSAGITAALALIEALVTQNAILIGFLVDRSRSWHRRAARRGACWR